MLNIDTLEINQVVYEVSFDGKELYQNSYFIVDINKEKKIVFLKNINRWDIHFIDIIYDCFFDYAGGIDYGNYRKEYFFTSLEEGYVYIRKQILKNLEKEINKTPEQRRNFNRSYRVILSDWTGMTDEELQELDRNYSSYND